MSILNARFLGPEGLGVVALLRLMQSLGTQFTDFGFGRSLRYYSASGEIAYHDLKRIIFILGPIVGAVSVITSLILKYLPLNVWNDIEFSVYLLFLPAVFFFIMTSYLRFLLHGQLLIKAVNISELLESIFYILLFVVFVWYLDWGLLGVSLALSISSGLIFFQLFLACKSYKQNKPPQKQPLNRQQILKKLWRYGRWTYYSYFVDYIFANFPVFFLKSIFGSFTLIGLFNKAKGLSDYVNRPARPLSGILFSYNAGSSAVTAAHRTETLCRLTFWVSTILFWTLALVIKPIIRFLYGDAFLPAADIFHWLYPNVVFSMSALYLSNAIAAKGLIKEVFLINLRSLPFIVVISFLLIVNFQIKGAAFALSLSSAVLWIQFLRKYLTITGSRVSDIFFLKKADFQIIKNLWNKIQQKRA